MKVFKNGFSGAFKFRVLHSFRKLNNEAHFKLSKNSEIQIL